MVNSVVLMLMVTRMVDKRMMKKGVVNSMVLMFMAMRWWIDEW